mgnify:CR=1 FL=1
MKGRREGGGILLVLSIYDNHSKGFSLQRIKNKSDRYVFNFHEDRFLKDKRIRQRDEA